VFLRCIRYLNREYKYFGKFVCAGKNEYGGKRKSCILMIFELQQVNSKWPKAYIKAQTGVFFIYLFFALLIISVAQLMCISHKSYGQIK
jgi:hypothetical protein